MQKYDYYLMEYCGELFWSFILNDSQLFLICYGAPMLLQLWKNTDEGTYFAGSLNLIAFTTSMSSNHGER